MTREEVAEAVLAFVLAHREHGGLGYFFTDDGMLGVQCRDCYEMETYPVPGDVPTKEDS